MGGDITHAVLEFLNGEELPMGLNDTAITLIPKVWNRHKISQFCPIALCPALYKIVVKAVANRVRVILDEVIGEEQSIFCPWALDYGQCARCI